MYFKLSNVSDLGISSRNKFKVFPPSSVLTNQMYGKISWIINPFLRDNILWQAPLYLGWWSGHFPRKRVRGWNPENQGGSRRAAQPRWGNQASAERRCLHCETLALHDPDITACFLSEYSQSDFAIFFFQKIKCLRSLLKVSDNNMFKAFF